MLSHRKKEDIIKTSSSPPPQVVDIRSFHSALTSNNNNNQKRKRMRTTKICIFLVLFGLAIFVQVKNQGFLRSSSNDDVDTRRSNKRISKKERKKAHRRQQKAEEENRRKEDRASTASEKIQSQQQQQQHKQQPPPTGPILKKRKDPLLMEGTWDVSPIVVEEYKLLFFSVPKVAATTFKHLFRRIKGKADWNATTPEGRLPHSPQANGLTYLWNYDHTKAEDMMTSPEWTRAIFVRDPQARLVSAYKDKVLTQNAWYMRQRYCGITQVKPKGTPESPKCPKGLQAPLQDASPECQNLAPIDKVITKDVLPLERFLTDFVIQCPNDPHWEPQAKRVTPIVWNQMNFVGRFEHLYDDAKTLLERIGAWDKYGSNGWEGGAIFKTNTATHRTATTTTMTNSTSSKQQLFKTPELLKLFYEHYRVDYEHPVMNFEKPMGLPEVSG